VPGGDILAVLDVVATAVARFNLDLFDEFKVMDASAQRVIPVPKFRNFLLNIGVREIDPLVSYYGGREGVRYLDFVEDLGQFGAVITEQRFLSPETKNLLNDVKVREVAGGVTVRSICARFDPGKTRQILRIRVRNVLENLGMRPSQADIDHLAQDFADPKMPDFIRYDPLLEYIDSLNVRKEEVRSISTRGASAVEEREMASMLNAFRGKLQARHKSAADAFRGCSPDGISQQEFRERLSALAIVLREIEIQRFIRKYRQNMGSDIDWVAFCRDIENSRTLEAIG
jgi:Ca2+-binding EF-hand superfamily protein